MRVGGFNSNDEEEGNSLTPEDYFPNPTDYGKVPYDTDTINKSDSNNFGDPDKKTSFLKGKLIHLRRKKRK